MDIENILECGNPEEVTTFLSYYIPMTFRDVESKPQVNFKEINKLIANGPDKYIWPVCIVACKELWKKNIFALASLEMKNDLYLILDKLNLENMNIFKEKLKENPKNYCINLGKGKYIGIRVENYKNEINLEEKFFNLVSDFKLQDVQRGFLNEKTFLMNICNCEKVAGLREYGKAEPEVIFDINKMEKSFKQYLKESGYDKFYVPEEHRIYINDYYYNAHKNYLDSLITI